MKRLVIAVLASILSMTVFAEGYQCQFVKHETDRNGTRGDRDEIGCGEYAF